MTGEGPSPRSSGRSKDAAVKALGGVAISFGGLTILENVHFFDHGVINLRSLVELGPGAAGVAISDGGVALACNPDWMIGPFAVNSSAQLDASPSSTGLGPSLADRIDQVARSMVVTAPSGSILLVGSGDDVGNVKANTLLATGRAGAVKAALSVALDKYQPDTPVRDILLGNEALAYVQRGKTGGEEALVHGLARMLYGEGELSTRSVQPCVLQPRPHRVEATGGGTGGYYQGLSHGLLVLAILILVGLGLAVMYRSRRATVQSRRSGENQND